MKQNILLLIFGFGILLLMAGSVLVGFAANELYFLQPVSGAPEITVTIPTGATLRSVSREVASAKLISSQWLFELYVTSRHLAANIRAGSYAIRAGTAMEDIVDLITTPGASEPSITVIEGWNIRDIAKTLAPMGVSVDRFIALVGTPPSRSIASLPSVDFRSDFPFLAAKPNRATLEGYLFPDTYRINPHADPSDLLHAMLTNFSLKVGAISYDDLTLASIVEREVRASADRRLVADIFKRRLAAGMPLQSDATVNYVTGKRTPSISDLDAATASPWNTYRNPGLPPTPIANPGLDAINAVRNPEPNSYWYFLTDASGTVHYARTLADHALNRKKFLK